MLYLYQLKILKNWRYVLWKESQLLILVIFAKALRTAAAVNARHHVSQHVRQAAVSQISSAKTNN